MALKYIFRNTIWGSEGISSIPPRFHLLYTLILPAQYALLMAYGLLILDSPTSSIRYVFGPIYADIWSYGLFVSGATALFGIVAEYKTPWVEAVGAVFLVTLLLLFAISLVVVAAVVGETLRVPSLPISLVLLSLTAWRILDISRELRPARHVS